METRAARIALNVFFAVLAVLSFACVARPGVSYAASLTDEEIAIARRFVDTETPESIWPFRPAELPFGVEGRRLVLVHYFPPLPISIDNKAAPGDYWSTQFMDRGGEKGKYSTQGGYVRQRPLPRPPWTTQNWREMDAAIDVLRAKRMEADGFGVDILGKTENQYWQQAQRICDAAKLAGPNFYFVPEIDGASFADATALEVANASEVFAKCPAAYRRADGRILFAPFSPNTQGADFWRNVESILADRGIQVAFVPDLLDAARFANEFAPISKCLTAWGERDPDSITSGQVQKVSANAKLLVGCWMQPIAPQDSRPKSSIFWEASNTRLLIASWMQAITGKADMVHLLTWNDFGETTQFSPSSGSQFLFYDLTAYFIQWYKTSAPPVITRDAIYYSHRVQIFDPATLSMPGDVPFKLLGKTPLMNDVEMVALLTSPATLEIELNGKRTRSDVQAGLQVLRFPASPGRPVFRILRNGQISLQKISDWQIEANSTRPIPDYFGGSTTRPFYPIPAN